MTQPMDRTPDPARTGEPRPGDAETRSEQELRHGEDGPGGGHGQAPSEQSPGHDHDDADTPDEVHPALRADDDA